MANLVESDANDLSKNTFGNLLTKTIKCNDGGSSLQQLWVEITKFLLVLSEKYSSVYTCDSSAVHYLSVSHSASNDASEFANYTSQASSPYKDTVDSILQLTEKESSCSSESASKLSCDTCQNDKMSVDTDSLVSENLTCSNISMRKISKEDTKGNGCDGEPPSQCKFQIPIFWKFFHLWKIS